MRTPEANVLSFAHRSSHTLEFYTNLLPSHTGVHTHSNFTQTSCIRTQVFNKILSDTAIENRKEYKEVVDFVRWVVREYFKLALEV